MTVHSHKHEANRLQYYAIMWKKLKYACFSFFNLPLLKGETHSLPLSLLLSRISLFFFFVFSSRVSIFSLLSLSPRFVSFTAISVLKHSCSISKPFWSNPRSDLTPSSLKVCIFVCHTRKFRLIFLWAAFATVFYMLVWSDAKWGSLNLCWQVRDGANSASWDSPRHRLRGW